MARTAALLDSGSAVTVFNMEVAALLGIEVTEGEPARVRTQGGNLDYYLFDLEMELDLTPRSVRFPARAGFFASHQARNILGRNLVFSHFLVGFHERRERVYLQPDRFF